MDLECFVSQFIINFVPIYEVIGFLDYSVLTTLNQFVTLRSAG
jgi:hypothetical protein